MSSPLLVASGITKTFGGVHALSSVGLEISSGEIHALCGENGAGKSTLIKILSGSLVPDAGNVTMEGQLLPYGDIAASEAAGIAVLYQESVAFPHLNAVENLFVGREWRRFGGWFIDKPAMRTEARALLDRLGEQIDLRRPVGELSLAQRQMIGIARALSRQSRLLILDEPTASLSARETETLFAILHQLRREGVAMLYVSHRLEEIFEMCDRVTVLRDGVLVATQPVAEVTRTDLIRWMVGRQTEEIVASPPPTQSKGTPLLEITNLSRRGEFEDITFSINAGEIVGLAGLVGAGRSEVARTIFGVTRADDGSVRIDGRTLRPGSIRAALQQGVALVPEDRQHLGLVLPLPVGTNLILAVLRWLAHRGWRSRKREREAASDLMRQLDVRASGPGLPAESLSGGNQQKVVLGKWLATSPRVLVLDEPTRGVDVGAKAEIHHLIRSLASQGVAVLVISSEIPEVISLCDRILVMRTGRISGELSRAEASQEKILELALPESGISPNAGAST